MNASSREIPAAVQNELLAPERIVRVDEFVETQGLSGARILRVASASKRYCLRRWPPSTSVQRVQQVHRVMTAAGNAQCPLVPRLFQTTDGRTWVVAQDHIWELTQWIEGQTVSPTDYTQPMVVAAFEGLAQFHRAVAPLHASQQTAPAIIARIERIAEIQNTGVCDGIPACEPPLRELAKRTLALWHTHRDDVREQLQRLASIPTGCQWTLRDVHCEHLIWQQSNGLVLLEVKQAPQLLLAGIVDYDALRIDTPFTDLARLRGSLHKCPSEWITAAIGAYREIAPLGQHAAQWIEQLDRATGFVASVNWMQWLCLEKRSFGARQFAAISRYQTMLERSERLLQGTQEC